MVGRLARMLDAGVLVLDGPSARRRARRPSGVRRRVAEREFEDDGWHVVTVPIAGRRAGSRSPAAPPRAAWREPPPRPPCRCWRRPSACAELAREQERVVRAALLDELLELAPGAETRGLAARAASFGVTFPARVVVS